MGISLYLIWISKTKNKSKALKVFYIQLGLNTLWSIIFFGFKAIGLAYVEIIFLWIFIFLSIKEFRKISKPASNLLFPYLAWVSFASLLNLSLWILNP
jgi:tryptophan-rich sensory protein